MQGGSQLDSQLRSVKSIALDHHDVHALTLLSSIVAGIGSEADRNESHARNFARVEVLRQLAPSSSNGVSVPLPTDTLVPSTRATPGYRVASVRLRRFGDGFTHPSAVESNQSPRIHPSIGMMVSFALILRSELYIFASSPMVIP